MLTAYSDPVGAIVTGRAELISWFRYMSLEVLTFVRPCDRRWMAWGKRLV
jgi:hypothetical protein